MKIRNLAVVVSLSVAMLLGACSQSSDNDTVLVMAAASLTDAFQDVEIAFEAAHPDLDVRLNVAGSATLREQILQGAPADVFAAANRTTMQAVIDGGAAQESAPFASNHLQIAIPIDNPGGIDTINDFADDRLFIGLCDQGVPCGDFARQALAQVGVEPAVDTNEKDVRSLLTKIAAGELDGGIVYETDVVSSADVRGIDLPVEVDVPISYPIAVLTEAPNTDAAQQFVDFVRSPEGQALLGEHGFGAP